MGDCPTPAKQRHPDKHSAKRHARSVSDFTGKQYRVYRCPCRSWHVTSWSWQRWQQVQDAEAQASRLIQSADLPTGHLPSGEADSDV